MRAPRFGRRDASLMQIAAAIVGSVGATQVIRPLAEPDIRCFDPHCPDFGDPSFGEGTCPAEHADAWRFRFKGDGS